MLKTDQTSVLTISSPRTARLEISFFSLAFPSFMLSVKAFSCFEIKYSWAWSEDLPPVLFVKISTLFHLLISASCISCNMRASFTSSIFAWICRITNSTLAFCLSSRRALCINSFSLDSPLTFVVSFTLCETLRVACVSKNTSLTLGGSQNRCQHSKRLKFTPTFLREFITFLTKL